MRGLGQIAELCAVAQPHVALVTQIGPEHLELVGTVENVARANAEAIEALPPGGIAVVPAGEPLLEPYLRRDDLEVRRFDAADHTIRMTDVRVRQLDVAAGSSNLHGAAQRLGTLAAESLLENQPLYRMKPAQADEMDRLGLVASPIRVGAQGISMTLSPRRD